MPRHHYYGQGLDKAFLRYQGFFELHYEDQIEFHTREIANAMQHFPKLRKVRMSTDAGTRPHTFTIEEAFCPKYSNPLPIDGQNQTLGVLQMLSLPLALQWGSSIIEELDCGSVDWRFLEVDDETFANMKESVSNLRRLSIEFSTTMDYQDYYGWWFDYENGLCAETLRKGRLRDFVTSSPLLGDLDIYFSSASSNRGIQDTVGNFHLACLKDA